MLKKITIATLAVLLAQSAIAQDTTSEERKAAIEKITTLKVFETPEILTQKHLAKVDEQKVFSKDEQKAIESIVHNYIINTPELLVEAQKRLNQKVEAEMAENLLKIIDFIKTNDNIPTFGDKDAENYVIEFSDYNCGYCKLAKPYIDQFVKEYNARIMYVELPILSPMSVKASAFGIALYRTDKNAYKKYNDYLMSQKGKITKDEDIKNAIAHIGQDYDKLDKKITEDKILDILVENIKLSHSMGIRGTPYYIINGKEVQGAIRSFDELKKAVGLK